MKEHSGASTLYRIRFHGRGGQGMKTASRILGSAFFQEGFQVQDAQRYGAERRGAPIFAYVRASCDPTGWGFDLKDSIKIGKLAVEAGVWPLKEYHDGSVTHTNVPRHRRAVEEYLRHQGRFSHLFLPQRNEELLQKIQSGVDAYWVGIED